MSVTYSQMIQKKLCVCVCGMYLYRENDKEYMVRMLTFGKPG